MKSKAPKRAKKGTKTPKSARDLTPVTPWQTPPVAEPDDEPEKTREIPKEALEPNPIEFLLPKPADICNQRTNKALELVGTTAKTILNDVADTLLIEPHTPLMSFNFPDLPPDVINGVTQALVAAGWDAYVIDTETIYIEMPAVRTIAEPPVQNRSTVRPL